jgi:hypothetical protein
VQFKSHRSLSSLTPYIPVSVHIIFFDFIDENTEKKCIKKRTTWKKLFYGYSGHVFAGFIMSSSVFCMTFFCVWIVRWWAGNRIYRALNTSQAFFKIKTIETLVYSISKTVQNCCIIHIMIINSIQLHCQQVFHKSNKRIYLIFLFVLLCFSNTVFLFQLFYFYSWLNQNHDKGFTCSPNVICQTWCSQKKKKKLKFLLLKRVKSKTLHHFKT